MFLMMEDPHWCVQNFFLQYSLLRFAVGFLLEAQVPSRFRIISRSACCSNPFVIKFTHSLGVSKFNNLLIALVVSFSVNMNEGNVFIINDIFLILENLPSRPLDEGKE